MERRTILRADAVPASGPRFETYLARHRVSRFDPRGTRPITRLREDCWQLGRRECWTVTLRCLGSTQPISEYQVSLLQSGAAFSTSVLAVYLRSGDHVDIDMKIGPEVAGWHGAVLTLMDTMSGEQVYSLPCDINVIAAGVHAQKLMERKKLVLKSDRRCAVTPTW